ncbi:hypothetical protein C6497_16045 [Candidatus Poribacteria bacterium]|nr:MAG: hypothetical protein C6497_16045 [Candidatus Poribacteria bacterium]
MTPNTKYRRHHLHKGRFSIEGAYYHIVICTHERQKILAIQDVTSIIFDTFDWLEENNRIVWICIMVMPDHVHSIIKLGQGQTLSKVLHSFKSFTAREINKYLSRIGQLWQKGYTDWGIRTEATLYKTIRYCYENPVRKGLVKNPEDYPYWRCVYDVESEYNISTRKDGAVYFPR